MGRISMPQGNGSQLHNRRDYEKNGKSIPNNIDSSLSDQNITLVDKDIKQVYEEIFGEALEKYNAKQKRADRKIESYYEHVKNSKNGEKLFYEDVIQWGTKDDFTGSDSNRYKRINACVALEKYVEGFEERNPNLKLIGAYIHMDEASPHLHLDYIPVAHGYKRGLETRNSLDRAMKEMGFVPENESRKNNATKLWKENEREVFGEICRDVHLEVEHERKSDRKNLTVDEYKDARDRMIAPLEQEREEIKAEIAPLKELKVEVDEIENTGKSLLGVVTLKKEEFETIKEQAKAYTANRNEIELLRERTVEVTKREENADNKEQQLKQQEHLLAQQQQQTQQLYHQQLNLNQYLRQSERENKEKAKVIEQLKAENEKLKTRVSDLVNRLRGAYESICNIVKAIGMLKYDNGDYKAKVLTGKQERLIDGLATYGANFARDEGFNDLAKDMEEHIGISKGIRDIVEPKTQHHHMRL